MFSIGSSNGLSKREEAISEFHADIDLRRKYVTIYLSELIHDSIPKINLQSNIFQNWNIFIGKILYVCHRSTSTSLITNLGQEMHI